jgi:hypothetical protein
VGVVAGLAREGMIVLVREAIRIAVAKADDKKKLGKAIYKASQVCSVVATDPHESQRLLATIAHELQNASRVLGTSPMVDFPPKAGEGELS